MLRVRANLGADECSSSSLVTFFYLDPLAPNQEKIIWAIAALYYYHFLSHPSRAECTVCTPNISR